MCVTARGSAEPRTGGAKKPRRQQLTPQRCFHVPSRSTRTFRKMCAAYAKIGSLCFAAFLQPVAGSAAAARLRGATLSTLAQQHAYITKHVLGGTQRASVDSRATRRPSGGSSGCCRSHLEAAGGPERLSASSGLLRPRGGGRETLTRCLWPESPPGAELLPGAPPPPLSCAGSSRQLRSRRGGGP